MMLGIAGPARSGKDTAAQILLEMGVCQYRYSFADPIRAMLKAGFGVDMADPYWIERKEAPIDWLGKSPRQMMQTLGTEWGRQLVNQSVWLLRADQEIKQRGPHVVIPDVRFENEAAWIRDRGGRILHLKRNAAPVAAHASEKGVVVWPFHDTTIENNDTIEMLRWRIRCQFA